MIKKKPDIFLKKKVIKNTQIERRNITGQSKIEFGKFGVNFFANIIIAYGIQNLKKCCKEEYGWHVC